MNKSGAAYIERGKFSKGKVLQDELSVTVDEKTGERCLVGYDKKSKMKITLLFKSEEMDAERIVTETLRRNFLERIKKEYV